MTETKAHRNTRQRALILEELRSCKSHPTASQLYGEVRKKLPHISLGTVYRNLETLCEQGEIKKIATCGTEARYDGFTEDHFHIRCERCGRLDDIPDICNKPVSDEITSLNGYRVLGYRMELTGICPDCLKEENEEGSVISSR